MLRPRGRLDSVCELCLELERRSSLFLPLRVVGSLSISAAQGRLEHVQHYVEHVEDDVNVRDAMGSAPLHHAAVAGHATIVRYLLVHGADVEARVGDEQDTALHLAARLGHDGVVSALLAQGANSEARNSMLLTPLLLATQHNRIAAMQVLLAGGARLDAPWLVDYDSARDVAEPLDSVASRRRHDSEVLACDRGTCVHLAAVVGHIQAAKLLIAAAGVDANLPTSRQYATPLHLAVRFGHAALASTLLSLGADVRARDVEGREPLHIASDYAYHRVLPDIQHGALERAHVAAVDVLLSAGAEVDARDASGKTALQLAVKQRHLLVGRALVEAGAMRRSRAGLLMLGLSAWAHEPRKLKVLMSAGKASGDDDSKRSSCTLSLADSELSDAEHDDDWSWNSDPVEGAACLHAACLAHDRRGLLFLVLHSDEDIDSGAPAALGSDVEGLTALQLAARDGWLRGVDALLTHGANAQARAPHDGSTALHLAAERGHISVVARLLAANTNVNTRDAHAATPLLRALRHGRGLMVRVLLQRGADLPAWDDEGHDDSVLDDVEPELTTTLHVAAFYGALDRVKELVEAGVAVDATDADGVTPAWLAALAGQFAVVAFLVGRGAELRSLPDSDSDESDEGDDRVWLSASSKPRDDDHSQLDSRRRSI